VYYAIPYHTILYYTTLTILLYIILYYTALHHTTLHYTPLHDTTLHYAKLRYTTLHYTIPCENHTVPYHIRPYYIDTILTILYCTIPYHTIPYHTIPCHTMLYYTILYYTVLDYTIQRAAPNLAIASFTHEVVFHWYIEKLVVFPFPGPESIQNCRTSFEINKEFLSFGCHCQFPNVNFGVHGTLALFLVTWSTPGYPKADPRRKRKIKNDFLSPSWVPILCFRLAIAQNQLLEVVVVRLAPNTNYLKDRFEKRATQHLQNVIKKW
jgi:hypothetical protein